jgi:ferric-dicitrate binding protein FerR (iron transport regulator)
MTKRGDEQDVTPEDPANDERTLERILRSTGPRDVPPAPGLQEVRAAVEAEWRSIVQSRQSRTRRWAWPLVAGIAASAIGVLVLLNRPAAPREIVATVDRLDGVVEHRGSTADEWQAVTAGAALREHEQIRTADDARLALTLGSGLQLRIDRGSTLAFNDLGHAALDAGAVYVDSGPPAANRAPALEITTPHGSVSHLGTQYEARLDGDALVVSVREGRVSVVHGAARVEGAAGEQLVIGDGRPVERLSLAGNATSWAWTGEIAPAYRVEGQTLHEFLEWAARETGREIRYADGAARDDASTLELHGSVEGLTPDQALTAVLATTSLPVTIDPTRIEVGDRLR